MISVIVPVYKVEPYLNRCIDSILNQTYKDLELILVDDGSPDNCPALCDQAAQRDHRVKVIHKANGGLSSARNAGIDIARGEYVAFVDSDDWIDADMYQTLLDIARKTGADIVECGYRWIKPKEVLDRENSRKTVIYTNLEAIEKLYFGDQMFGGISIVAWNKLYKIELFREIRFLEGRIHEDVEATPRLLLQANKIAKYNYNFYNFFFSPNSISRSPYNLNRLDAIVVKKRVVSFYSEKGLQRYSQFVESLLASELYGQFYECMLRRKNAEYFAAGKWIRKEEKKQYHRFRKNVFMSQWKVLLFHYVPNVYCLLLYIYRKIK